MSSGFVGLHIHSEFSALDGRGRCDEMAAQAVANGDEALAITDHDECGGHLAFQEACRNAGIKPIFGEEARWVHDIAESRANKTGGHDASHIVLLARDQQGLRNLWSLSSLAYEEENFYGKPQLNPGLLREYSAGLWASDGCGLTRFTDHVENGDEDAARAEWATLLDIFGDRFYSELHTFRILEPKTEKDHWLNNRIMAMNRAKVRFASEMGVPLVVVNDAHYAREDQWEQHRLIWNMSVKSYKKDQVDSKGHAADWMMNRAELIEHMAAHGVPVSVVEEAITNTVMIAESCNVEITPTLKMPRLEPTDELDAALFRRSVEEGFKRFILDRGLPEEPYRQRLEYEAKLITDQGMTGYFNVVADYVQAARDGSYIQWVEPQAKKKPCLCGPGRGSGGGSLVNYLLGITSLDPIKYDLMFERFINPDRPDYPDIDVDFQKSHRPGLKSYLGARYGEGNVCSIGLDSRSGPKQTLKDIARAMGIEFADVKKMVDLVGEIDQMDEYDENELDEDQEPPTWDEVLAEMGGELAPWARKHPLLFERMEQMVLPRGLVRNHGVHAAGVVVNDGPILGAVPTRVNKGIRSTQFDMNEVAALGGVKDDLLANKGLDVLAIARDLVYQRHRVWLDYDGFGFGVPKDCPPENVVTFGDEHYEDPAIWEQIDRGHTAGIFQIGTPGGTKQAMRFRPRSLPELADLVSINRPGVIRAGLLDTYLARRRGEEEVVYDHPMMEPITGRTMGILVYQEDLIRTAREIAGFTAGEAEALRKAIGKKLADKMAEMEPKFISGCLANAEFMARGGSEKVAHKLWMSLSAAGAYAFNRAHATGYAMQPCWEIWTKHYFFDEFITGCLAVYENKTETFIRECRRRSRPVQVPDINTSGARFTLAEGGVRYGLVDVRGVGDAVMPEITRLRPFASLPDYLARTTKQFGGKKGVVDSLVKVGAFDALHPGVSRVELMKMVHYHWASLKTAEGKWAKLDQAARDKIVADRIAKHPAQYPTPELETIEDITAIEIEMLGTFVTHDPMEKYAEMIEGECIRHPNDIVDFDTGEIFTIGGELTRIKLHTQRNGKQMAFLSVRWAEEDFDIVAFADAWGRCKMLMQEGVAVACQVIKLNGKGCQLSHVERLDWILEDRLE